MNPRYVKLEETYDVPMDKILELLSPEIEASRYYSISVQGNSRYTYANERVVTITVTRTRP